VTTATEHILQRFCDSSNLGKMYGGAYPWFVDGKAFATDSRIAAWIDSDPFESPPKGNLKQPNAAKIMAMFQGELEPLEISSDVCNCCKGVGFTIEERCSQCKGSGRVRHECDCEHCDTKYEDCDECDGKGRFTGEDAKIVCDCQGKRVNVLGHDFAFGYLQKIAALGNPMVAVKDGVMSFKCGDVTGVLMGLVPLEDA
jgi:hypothetical protein